MSDTKVNKIDTINLGQRGIVYEGREAFEKSLFHKVYDRATTLVRESVREQLQTKNKVNCNQIENIITFVGRRGTGKTSSMLSFMEGLKHNSDGGSKYSICNKYKRPVNFINLEWIDASLLEKSEDIFEIVLAKMLGEFLKCEERSNHSEDSIGYEAHNLHQHFGQIYKKVLNLKKRNELNDFGGDTAIASLRDLARSNDLRNDFEDLVKLYIRVMTKYKAADKENTEEAFLVLAIDDADMNVDCGFEILEDIQRYLKVKGLIVLLAINYEQMLICCEKHFSRLYLDYSYAECEKRNYIARIAEEYMEKALPTYMRTYLPSLKKKDYDRSIVGENTRKASNEMLDIKKCLFQLAYQKVLVRYDCGGKKRHFIEPSTLRSLNNQYLFYDALDDVKDMDSNAIDVTQLDWNYKRCMNDLLFRFVYENLENRERKFFIELSEADIRRRGEIIVSRLIHEINRQDLKKFQYIRKNKEQEFVHEFLEECKNYGYSYGELMRSFYFYSREDIFDKKLVQALLAMYTLALTRIFYRYKETELQHPEKVKKNFGMLKTVLADSAAGSWGLYLMPRLKSNIYKKGKFTGAIKKAKLSRQFMDYEILKRNEENDAYQKAADFVEDMTDLFLFILFLTELRNESGESVDMEQLFEVVYEEVEGIKPDSDDLTEKSEKIQIRFSDITCCFNVMNFVNTIFCFEERMNSFIKLILKQCFPNQFNENIEDIVGRIKEILLAREDTFYFEMNKWIQKYGSAVVPFYSTDLYYNMLKRIVRKHRLHPVQVEKREDLYKHFQQLLLDIEKMLKQSDEYYFGKDEKDSAASFEDCFKACPVIKRFLMKDRQVEKLFNDMLERFVDQEDNGNMELDELDEYSLIFD